VKINIDRLFDSNTILKSTDDTFKLVVRGLSPFFDFVNAGLWQLVRALNGEITFKDNLKGQIVEVSLKDSVPTKVAVTSRDILTLLLLSTESNTIYGFDRSFTDAGDLQITAYFRATPTPDSVKCRFFVAFN